MNEGRFHIPASSYLEALERNGVDHVVTVPDWVQLALHERLDADHRLRQIRCCNEDQAVCVAAGLTVAGRSPVVLVQNQGIYGCINSIRAICLDAAVPIVFLVGQFGREFANFGQNPALSKRNPVRCLEPVLDAMSVRHWRLEEAADLAHIDAAFRYARTQQRSAALIVGAPTGWQ